MFGILLFSWSILSKLSIICVFSAFFNCQQNETTQTGNEDVKSYKLQIQNRQANLSSLLRRSLLTFIKTLASLSICSACFVQEWWTCFICEYVALLCLWLHIKPTELMHWFYPQLGSLLLLPQSDSVVPHKNTTWFTYLCRICCKAWSCTHR